LSDIGLSEDVSTADTAAAGLGGAQSDDTDNAEAYNSIAFGRSPQDVYNTMMGITDKNPYGVNVPGFIKGLSSIFGPLDYTNILGSQQAIDAMADRQFGLAMNPQNQPGMVGYNSNVPTVTTGVREGLTRGFGSLFGSPVGFSTTRGTVQAQRAADPLGSVMRGAFALAAPMSLPSLAAQTLGKNTYTTSFAPDYDPTKDPNSPSYTGPSSLGGIVDLSLLGSTGMTSTTAQEVYGVAKEAVEEAIDYFSNPKGGIDTVTSVPDNRSFDAFGNVVSSPASSSLIDNDDQINAGILGLDQRSAKEANTQVADSSSLFSPQSISQGLNYFAGPQIQDFFRGVTNNPNVTTRIGPGYDIDKQKMDDNLFSINIPFSTG